MKNTTLYHTLNQLDEVQYLGETLGKIELFVVCQGQTTTNGNFIETITAKPTVIYDYGYEYYVRYHGKKCRVIEVNRGVCCGTDLAIETPE
jgi:hypothetical protein